MYSPSDFNTDVPPFDNGSYASQPLNPQYVEAPDSENYVRGTEPLQTLPAQWWNWLCNQFTGKFNGVNKYVKNLFTELSNLLSLMGITPSEPTVPTGTQLSTGFLNNYPNVISKFIHTVASIWSYTGTTVVGDVTTTQTTKLAVFEHINESDASTTPATETDTYNTKYVDQLPVKLGGTDSDNANGAMVNLVSPLSKVASGSGSINDMVVFDRLNTGGTHTVAKMDLNELGRIVSQSFINTPVIITNTNVINNVALQSNDQITILFTGDIIGANTTTPLEIVYNSVNIPVMATKNGALTPVYAYDIYDGTVHTYKFLQAYTTLNLIYDGTSFVIIGNPIVLSDTDYVIYSDGSYKWLSYSTTERWTGKFWTDGKPIYRKNIIDTLTSYTDSGNRRNFSKSESIANVECIINSNGYYKYLDGNYDIETSQVTFFSSASTSTMENSYTNRMLCLNNTVLCDLFISKDFATTKVYLNFYIEYTKSTDSAGDVPPFSN